MEVNFEIKLAKTCSTCVHAKFNGKGNLWSSFAGKKQLGICMVNTTGNEPPLPSESLLYDHVARYGYMMDLQDYINEVWSSWYDNSERRLEQLQHQAIGGEPHKDWWYDLKTMSGASFRVNDNYTQPTIAEYREGHQKLVDSFDRFENVHKDLSKAVETYDKFNTNFEWWQANKMLMRRCHRNTVCDAHVEVARREPVARAVANGKHQLEWLDQ